MAICSEYTSDRVMVRLPPILQAFIFSLLAPLIASQFVYAESQEPDQHFPFGLVESPVIAPQFEMLDHNAQKYNLRDYLKGKTTAVQLIFTGCSATCPIQGSLFSVVSKKVNNPDLQLLSISIDPLNDKPKQLKQWLGRFKRYSFWQASAPKFADVDKLFEYFNGRVDGVDNHTGQIYVFDATGHLVYKTAEMPSSKHVVNVLEEINRRSKLR